MTEPAATVNALDSVRQPEPSPRLLEILVCPATKAPLDYSGAGKELVSQAARLAFPIRDGIPIMLIDEARRLSN